MILLQVGNTYSDLQTLISGLYADMIPLASRLISVGQGVAGLGGVIYVFYRLWPVMAGKEPLDFYPLLRPFALFLVIIFYMGLIDVLNAVLTPVVDATNTMVNYQNQTVAANIKRKQNILRNQAKKPIYQQKEEEEGWLYDVANKVGAAEEFLSSIPEMLETSARKLLAYILEIAFYAAGLIISSIRTFYLIMLVIIGPLALGFSIFPGFEGTFNSWLSRYVQIFMWLPIANILGTIISRFQALMVEKDIERLMQNGNYDGADLGYLIFLLFGICSYMTIPSVASWIIESSGAGRALRETSHRAIGVGRAISAGTGNYGGNIVKNFKEGYAQGAVK
ncbi:hypothetical protein GXP67_30935 [Rhodocytophaga rosea]|uniref:Conjugative transposon TraJ C-terminal domain-containing protein n=1 Tax=Rhodocytophaga rosea TaxID=2704465 RepID=A0A6C0GRN5_9BACT|nr:type IV secretion system protein [Rhodocytophaga rosea]QHT70751.1 hypothetical protein GXP67_30935 [Rhodocytophaga rosea]